MARGKASGFTVVQEVQVKISEETILQHFTAEQLLALAAKAMRGGFARPAPSGSSAPKRQRVAKEDTPEVQAAKAKLEAIKAKVKNGEKLTPDEVKYANDAYASKHGYKVIGRVSDALAAAGVKRPK